MDKLLVFLTSILLILFIILISITISSGSNLKENFSLDGFLKKHTDQYGRIKYIKYPAPPTDSLKAIGRNLEGVGIGIANALIGNINVMIDLVDVVRFADEAYDVPKHIHH